MLIDQTNVGELFIVTGSLTPTPPFDLDKSLDFLGDFASTEGEQRLMDRALRKAVTIDERAVVFEVVDAGSTAAPCVEYTLHSAQPLSPDVRDAVLDRISFFLSLHDDLQPFYAIAARDAAFAPIVERLYGYHQVKFLTPFENACWAVLTQRTPIATARTIKQKLLERCGTRLDLANATCWAFPEPAALAAVGAEELTELVGNARKASYLSAVAHAFAAVNETWLRTAAFDEVEAWLRAIKGIGAWSAAFVLIRGLGRMERLPIEDRLIEAAARVYRQPVTRERLAELAAPYESYAGYWAHYLRVAS